MFVPFYLQEHFNKAQITDRQGRTRPLVASEKKIVLTGKAPADFRTGGITPIQSAAADGDGRRPVGISRQKSLWGIDLILFAAAEHSGLYIEAFSGSLLATSSSKPQLPAVRVSSAAPHLSPSMLIRVKRKKASRYMRANFIV